MTGYLTTDLLLSIYLVVGVVTIAYLAEQARLHREPFSMEALGLIFVAGALWPLFWGLVGFAKAIEVWRDL